MGFRLKSIAPFLPYLVALIVGVIEFYLLYHADLPPQYGYSPLPKQAEIQKLFDIHMLANVGLYTYLLTIPLELAYLLLPITFRDFSSVSLFLSFIVAFVSVFVAIRYYLKKYFNAGNVISSLIAIVVDIPFQITYYNYGWYPAIYLLMLAIYDYGLDFKKLEWREALRNGLVLALGTSLGFQDPRAIFYTTLTFFAYLVYFIITKESKIDYLKNFLKVLIFGILFLVGLDFQMIVAIYLLRQYVSPVAVTTVYSQLTTPVTWYYPIYTLLGTINFWSPLAYKSYYLLGAISSSFIFLSILKRNRISLFFSTILLIIVAYDFLGTRTIGYALVNSPYVGYSIYLYVQYIPDYVFSAYFYPLLAFTFYSIYFLGKNLLRYKFTKIYLIFAILVSSLVVTAYYQPAAASMSEFYATVPLSESVKGSIYQVSNASGLVLVLYYGEDYHYYDYYLNNMLSPTGYPGVNIWYTILQQSPNPAKALSYLGVQYVIVDASEYPECYKVLLESPGIVKVYNSDNIYVFENLDFKPYYISRGVYIAFNFPYAILGLSNLSDTYTVIPFYYVNDLQELLPYVKGFIGYNVSVNDIIPMLINNNSYIISADYIYVNELVDTDGYNHFNVGWYHSNPYFLPDLMNALTSGPNAKPLTIHVNIPDGVYYVYAVLAFDTYNPYASGSITISSGNIINKEISTTVYNITWVYLGELSITEHKIVLDSVSPILNIVKIVLVPSNEYKTLEKEAEQLLSSRQVIDLSTGYVHNGTYSPKGYSVIVWANPWFGIGLATHEVKVSGDVVNRYEYYFGVAEIFISNNLPKINVSRNVNILVPTLSFLVNTIAVLSLLITRKYNHLKLFYVLIRFRKKS